MPACRASSAAIALSEPPQRWAAIPLRRGSSTERNSAGTCSGRRRRTLAPALPCPTIRQSASRSKPADGCEASRGRARRRTWAPPPAPVCRSPPRRCAGSTASAPRPHWSRSRAAAPFARIRAAPRERLKGNTQASPAESVGYHRPSPRYAATPGLPCEIVKRHDRRPGIVKGRVIVFHSSARRRAARRVPPRLCARSGRYPV